MDFSKAFNKKTTVRLHQDLFQINNMKSKISLPSTFSTEIENRRLLAPDFIFNQTWRQIALEVEGRIRRKLWLSRTISSRNHRNAADLTTKVFFRSLLLKHFFHEWKFFRLRMKRICVGCWESSRCIDGWQESLKGHMSSGKSSIAFRVFRAFRAVKALKAFKYFLAFRAFRAFRALKALTAR